MSLDRQSKDFLREHARVIEAYAFGHDTEDLVLTVARPKHVRNQRNWHVHEGIAITLSERSAAEESFGKLPRAAGATTCVVVGKRGFVTTLLRPKGKRA